MYLVSYVGVSLLLSLWVLPGLVAALTPVPYRARCMSRTRDALVTRVHDDQPVRGAAAADRGGEGAGARVRRRRRGARRLPDVIVPASFNFPHTGKLLSLSFVLFAGWFADAPCR